MLDWNPSEHAKDMWVWGRLGHSITKAKLLHIGTTPGDGVFGPTEYYINVTYLHGREHQHLILGYDCFHTKREAFEQAERDLRKQSGTCEWLPRGDIRAAENIAKALAEGVDD